MGEGIRKPKLIYVVSEDWYFCSHRLAHAQAALAAGFDVLLATHVLKHALEIERAGIKLIPLEMVRSSRNPVRELQAVMELFRIYRHERPDIVHHVAMKPVLYGSIAALLAGVPYVVNALAGLGYLFVSKSKKALPLRVIVRYAFKFLLNRSQWRVIVQNPDDWVILNKEIGVAVRKLALIRGSGVDPGVFVERDPMNSIPLVVLPARMLWDKGVGEFVQAASKVKSAGLCARFALVGDVDEANPSSIPHEQLEAWRDAGLVEWWGRQDDMPGVFAACDIVCLPSYREGLPKALLEAASAGKPIVATNVPGCREIVLDGENGLLVQMQDADALAGALIRLINTPDLRARMGKAGRKLVEQEFSVSKIAGETLSLYQDMLSCRS